MGVSPGLVDAVLLDAVVHPISKSRKNANIAQTFLKTTIFVAQIERTNAWVTPSQMSTHSEMMKTITISGQSIKTENVDILQLWFNI